jgi:hypothetical protein
LLRVATLLVMLLVGTVQSEVMGLHLDIEQQAVTVRFREDIGFPIGLVEFELYLNCSTGETIAHPAEHIGRLKEQLGLRLPGDRIWMEVSPLSVQGSRPVQFRCFGQEMAIYSGVPSQRVRPNTCSKFICGEAGLPSSTGDINSMTTGALLKRDMIAYSTGETQVPSSWCGSSWESCYVAVDTVSLMLPVDGWLRLNLLTNLDQSLPSDLKGFNYRYRLGWVPRGYLGVLYNNTYYPLAYPKMHYNYHNDELRVPFGETIQYYWTADLEAERWLNIQMNPQDGAFFVRWTPRPSWSQVRQ